MTHRPTLLLAAITVLLLAAPAFAQDAGTRHLVYRFSKGIQTDSRAINPTAPQMQHGGTPSPTNDQVPMNTTTTESESSGVSSDDGAITIDVFSPQADGGLHVRVSESSHTSHSAPIDCVVYPSTSVACATRISAEAALVLSTLSPQFFQPSTLDAKNHWREGLDIPDLSLDFTASSPSGSVVSITEERNQKLSAGAGGTVHGSATFTYDTVKRVTTNLKDHETIQQGEGAQSSNTTVDITATLTSDSATAKN